MKSIGSARFRDFDRLLKWHSELTPEKGRKFADDIQQKLIEIHPEFCGSFRRDTDAYIISDIARDMYKIEKSTMFGVSEEIKKGWEERDWKRSSEKTADQLNRFYQFSTEFEQPINVAYWNELFAYLYFGNPDKGIVVPSPEEYFSFTPVRDMSDTSLSQLRAMLGVEREGQETSWVPAELEKTLTPRELAGLKTKQQDEMAKLEEELKKVKNAETEELAEIKAQMDALKKQLEEKQRDAMLELEVKRSEMEDKMDQLNTQIFMLDSQIYAIQCFAGETVKFAHIRKGTNAPATEPVIVHQKLRFLDEDLGRMASIYQLDWENIGMFEEFLKYSPEALETFAPDKRCVTLVRLSKTNTQIGMSDKYVNLLRTYEYYHGRTVGIIIRNGENLYLGWTDEDRVYIQDDFIISKAITKVEPAQVRPQYSDELAERQEQRRERKKEYEEKMNVLNGVVSRAFVFNILQGVVKNTSWLPLPAGESLTKPSPYVRYSLADMCLEDRRFSDFGYLVKQANRDVAMGDALLSMQHLRPHSGQHYHNDRGRGYSDRTHDVRVEDCTVYEANLVEITRRNMVRYKKKRTISIGVEDEWIERVSEDSEDLELPEGAVVLKRYEDITRKVFASLKKEYSYQARANFQLYEDEYINLTFMNSVWLLWAINTKNLGNWRVKGTEIIYAHAIRYLNTALDYVRKREEEEKEYIDAIDPEFCANNPDWPLLLSDWKLMLSRDKERRTVRKITPFQAKRFMKWIEDGMPGRQNFNKPEGNRAASESIYEIIVSDG